MKNLPSENELTNWLADLLRADVQLEEGIYVFSSRGSHNIRKHVVSAASLRDVLARLSNKEEYDDTALVDAKSYEVLVREESRFLRSVRGSFASEDSIKEDSENGLTYKLTLPTDNYLVFLLSKLYTLNSRTFRRMLFMPPPFRRLP